MPEDASSLLIDEVFDVEYVAEGAANVVFRLIPCRGQLQSASLTLLRVRKDLPTVTTVIDAYRKFDNTIAPHVDQRTLVGSRLAYIPDTLTNKCNALLVKMETEGLRPKKRRNQYVAYQRYASLVKDMSRRCLGDTTIEFKLKWLSQSPTAPVNSKRCRTCALRAMRHGKAPLSQSTAAFCPLDLVSNDDSVLTRIMTEQMETLWIPHRSKERMKDIIDAVVAHLRATGILSTIKALQEVGDPYGVLRGKVDDLFLMAMTMRDCTMFIRVDEKLNVEARLGDIDLKPASKAGYWHLIEKRLIDEGWYTCSESSNDIDDNDISDINGTGDDHSHENEDIICALSRAETPDMAAIVNLGATHSH